MPRYTLEEFASLLTKKFASFRPRVTYDVTDKGAKTMEFLIENTSAPRFSVSLQAMTKQKLVESCTLWFGQAEISGMMNPDMAPSAIETIIDGDLVAILHYKNQDAYENHRPSGHQWLYQLTDDEDDDSEDLEKMKQRLASPPSLAEKLGQKYTGVFEIYSWDHAEILNR